MKAAISILLSASVFACPLICHTGHAADRSHGKTRPACCCDHCTQPPSNDKSPHHPGQQHHSDGCCQGICGGAVVQNGAHYDVALDNAWSLPLATIELALPASVRENILNRWSLAPWPDDGTNRGRALCCLYSTLLC